MYFFLCFGCFFDVGKFLFYYKEFKKRLFLIFKFFWGGLGIGLDFGFGHGLALGLCPGLGLGMVLVLVLVLVLFLVLVLDLDLVLVSVFDLVLYLLFTLENMMCLAPGPAAAPVRA